MYVFGFVGPLWPVWCNLNHDREHQGISVPCAAPQTPVDSVPVLLQCSPDPTASAWLCDPGKGARMSTDLERLSLNSSSGNSLASSARTLSANVKKLHNALNLLLSDLEREQFIHCLNVYHSKRNVYDLVQTLKVILNVPSKRQLLPYAAAGHPALGPASVRSVHIRRALFEIRRSCAQWWPRRFSLRLLIRVQHTGITSRLLPRLKPLCADLLTLSAPAAMGQRLLFLYWEEISYRSRLERSDRWPSSVTRATRVWDLASAEDPSMELGSMCHW